MNTEKNEPRPPRFPLFVSLDGKPVLVVGGGPIGARRARVLLDFGAEVTVVSPELCPDMELLQGRILWRKEMYTGGVSDFALAVAATDNREVNRAVGRDCREAEIPVSVADCKEESTFWFPAVVHRENLIVGIVSSDGDHRGVKAAAVRIRESWEGSD